MRSTLLKLPDWLTAEEAREQMPAAAWPMISNAESLTQALRAQTNQKICHRLLHANWGSASPIERQALHLSPQEKTWLRTIEWRLEDQLWVVARAVFPESTIQASESQFTGLGVQALGEVLFQDPSLRREPFSYSLIDKESAYANSLGDLLSDGKTVWARRSIVYFKNLPILITEIFLPESYEASAP